MKLMQLLLLEYSDKLINTMIGVYAPQTSDSEDQIKANIKRFEQLTNSIASKLGKNPAIDSIIPDELKVNNKFRDITQYKTYDLLLKIIKAVDSKPVDSYKQAIEYYKKRDQYLDPRIIGNYVARFKQNLNNLITKIEDKDPEALGLVNKMLLNKDAYKNILNWHNFHDLELMLDTLFPVEGDFEGEVNSATAKGDIIYNQDDIEIFKGDSESRCIYYTKNHNVKKYGKGYGWCIGNTMYSSYRYMQNNANLNRMFYFIFDRTLPATDTYHAVVLHAFAGGGYTRTTAKNGDETNPKSWKELSQLFTDDGPSGIKVWNKIKNLESLFKFIEPNNDEQRRIGFRGQRKTLNQFALMDNEDKLDWLRANATNRDIVTNKIVKSIPPQGEVSRNELINYDRLFTFDELKDSAPLVKRYAEYRFSRYPNEQLPIIFLPYLKEESKLRYYNEYFDKENKDGGDGGIITFEYAEKYFGKEVAKQYVNKQAANLAYIPENAISYIENSKLATLYKTIYKLYKYWKYDDRTNLDDTELEKSTSMPPSNINAFPFPYEDWKNLEQNERKIILEISKKYGNSSDPRFEFIKYAIPFVIVTPNGDNVLLPKNFEEIDFNASYNEYTTWVLSDVTGKMLGLYSGEETTLLQDSNNSDNIIAGFPDNIFETHKYMNPDEIKLVPMKEKLKEIYKLIHYRDMLFS